MRTVNPLAEAGVDAEVLSDLAIAVAAKTETLHSLIYVYRNAHGLSPYATQQLVEMIAELVKATRALNQTITEIYLAST